jgi:hypothetical protein
MKKYVLIMIVALLAGMTLNCSTPVPQNSFRVKTRGKFHLFGIPLWFSVPNPNIALNLKTTTAPGTAGTTGSVSEFNPGGANTETDISGKFDAVNAVLPAPWNAKVAPNQSRCTTANVPTLSFSAVRGGTYKINCKWNIQISLLVEPGFVDLTGAGSGGNSLTGVNGKSSNEESLFSNAQNLKIQYYRQVDGEDYVLESTKNPISVSADGTELLMPLPNNYSLHGFQHYRLVVIEDGSNDVYLSHGELGVEYPAAPTPTPTPCPPIMLCDPES